MPLPTSMADISLTSSLNYPAGTDLVSGGDDALRTIQTIMKAQVSSGAGITAASTITPDGSGQYYTVSGGTTISTIASTYSWNGRVISLRFSSSLTLTYSANLILPAAASITVAAGDIVDFVQESAGVWRMTNYQPVNSLGGGAAAGVFYENSTTLNVNYTISTGSNALAAGPLSIATGVTLTVPDGSTLTIV